MYTNLSHAIKNTANQKAIASNLLHILWYARGSISENNPCEARGLHIFPSNTADRNRKTFHSTKITASSLFKP